MTSGRDKRPAPETAATSRIEEAVAGVERAEAALVQAYEDRRDAILAGRAAGLSWELITYPLGIGRKTPKEQHSANTTAQTMSRYTPPPGWVKKQQRAKRHQAY